MSKEFNLSPRVLTGVRTREDAVVDLLVAHADPKLIEAAYHKYWNYLMHHVFPKRWVEHSSSSYSSLCSIFSHQWANSVNNPFFSNYRRNPNRAISCIRNTSLLLENATQFTDIARALMVDETRRTSPSITISCLVEQAIAIANPSKTHHVVLKGKGALSNLDAYAHNLENKFRNFSAILELLTNAVKYSPEDSTITLHFTHNATMRHYGSHRASGKDIRYKYAQSERIDYFFLTITDQGIGIPVAEIPLVTQSSYRATNTTNIHGTGFGLGSIDLGKVSYELPIRIISPVSTDPDFPGTSIRICLASW